jgi:hypothetical protein
LLKAAHQIQAPLLPAVHRSIIARRRRRIVTTRKKRSAPDGAWEERMISQRAAGPGLAILDLFGPPSLLAALALAFLLVWSPAARAGYERLTDADFVLTDYRVTSAQRVGRATFRYTLGVTLTPNVEVTEASFIGIGPDGSTLLAPGWAPLRDLSPGVPVQIEEAFIFEVRRNRTIDWSTMRLIVEGFVPDFPEFVLDTTSLDFGSPSVGCPVQRSFTVGNAGTAQLDVEFSDAQSPDDVFRFVRDGARYPIAPGAERTLRVTYRSVDTLERLGSQTLLTNDASQPEVLLQARGAGVAPEAVSEQFVQAADAAPEVDIIFLLDTSGSMSDDIANVNGAAGALLEGLIGSGVDYHVTYVHQLDGCPSGLVPYIDRTMETDAAQAALEALTAADSLQDHALAERLFTLAETALSDVNLGPGGCLDGFLRDDARLAIVPVSDEPEQSANAFNYYVELFQGLKDDPDDVRLHAVAGDYPSGCGSASAGSGYFEASAATGGLYLSVCTDDWAPLSGLLTEGIGRGASNVFELAGSAVPESVSVTVDGEAADAVLTRVDGSLVLSQTPLLTAPVARYLIFDQEAIPEAGAVVRVDYLPLVCD